jgi:DNA-binding PadR family transcriptional regulator
MMMLYPLPEIPELAWFEVEILFFLREKERYGNEMLAMLNEHLGEGTVSSGKLYSDLKKMEKRGSIKRTKRKRAKGEGLMTRGVDRVYFEITAKGSEDLRKAENYMRSWQFITMLKRTSSKIRTLIGEDLSETEEGATIGVAMDSGRMEVMRTMGLLPDNEGMKFVFLLISTMGDLMSVPFPDKKGKDMATFPSKVDDIPLKSDYLDAVISTYPLYAMKDKEKYLEEIVRIVRPGGRVTVVDFARTGSQMVEEIMEVSLSSDITSSLDFLDSGELKEYLIRYLKDVKIDRYKEQHIVSGIKR